jgi:hypothetical protein
MYQKKPCVSTFRKNNMVALDLLFFDSHLTQFHFIRKGIG